jgi:hypothetical protein
MVAVRQQHGMSEEVAVALGFPSRGFSSFFLRRMAQRAQEKRHGQEKEMYSRITDAQSIGAVLFPVSNFLVPVAPFAVFVCNSLVSLRQDAGLSSLAPLWPPLLSSLFFSTGFGRHVSARKMSSNQQHVSQANQADGQSTAPHRAHTPRRGGNPTKHKNKCRDMDTGWRRAEGRAQTHASRVYGTRFMRAHTPVPSALPHCLLRGASIPRPPRACALGRARRSLSHCPCRSLRVCACGIV